MSTLKTTVRIRTPQHKNGEVFDYTVQEGYIDRQSWSFTPVKHISGSVGMHTVDFEDEKDFKKYQVL